MQALGHAGYRRWQSLGMAALLLVLLAPTLSGCLKTTTPSAMEETADAGPSAEVCCADPERFPPLLVNVLAPGAPVFGRIAASMVGRHGYLHGDEAAIAHLMGVVEPLDIMLVGAKGRMSHNLIPGAFAHVAAHLGDEKALRRLGVWDDPAVVPHREAVKAGAGFIESDRHGVHLSTPQTVFNVDRVVVLRPTGLTPRDRAGKLVDFFGHVGTRFDFHFNADDDKCLFCAELVNHVMPEAGFPTRKIYGRTMILPDEIIAAALRGDAPLELVTYVRGTPGGWTIGDAGQLRADLDRAWSPAAGAR
jgi:hypothetical protein